MWTIIMTAALNVNYLLRFIFFLHSILIADKCVYLLLFCSEYHGRTSLWSCAIWRWWSLASCERSVTEHVSMSTASDPDCHRRQRPCHAGHSHQLVLAVCSDSDLSHLQNGFDVFRDTPLIWSIHFSVNNPVQQSLVAVLVLTQLDHGCTACSPSSMPERGVSTIQLQVKCDVNKHISQWLYCTSYAADLRFRLAVLVCCCLVDTALTSNPRQSM